MLSTGPRNRRTTGSSGLSDLFNRNDADAPAVRSMIRKLDPASHLGEQGIVLTATHIRAGAKSLAALSDEDRAARHQVAIESLDAEALRIAVAPVTGAALSFFVCHDELLAPAFGPAACS